MNPPSAVAGPGLAFDRARSMLVLFGGLMGECSFQWCPITNETWEWDGTDWTLRSLLSSPTPRWGAAMTFDEVRNRVLLFGGGKYREVSLILRSAPDESAKPLKPIKPSKKSQSAPGH